MGGTNDVPAHEYGELGYQANTHTTSNSSSVSLKIKLIDVEIQQSGSYYCSGDRLSEDQPELYKTVKLEVHGKFYGVPFHYTVELQWLFWDHENMFETEVVRANEC